MPHASILRAISSKQAVHFLCLWQSVSGVVHRLQGSPRRSRARRRAGWSRARAWDPAPDTGPALAGTGPAPAGMGPAPAGTAPAPEGKVRALGRRERAWTARTRV